METQLLRPRDADRYLAESFPPTEDTLVPAKTVSGQLGTYTRSLAGGKIAKYTAIVTLPSGNSLAIAIELNRFDEDPMTTIGPEEVVVQKVIDRFDRLKSEFADHYLPHVRQYSDLAKDSFPEIHDSCDQIQDHQSLVAALCEPELRVYDQSSRKRVRELTFHIRGTANIERSREGVWADEDEEFPDLGFSVSLNNSGEVVDWEQ